jgi:hypothetical protein
MRLGLRSWGGKPPPDSIRLAQWIGLPARIVAGVSVHSTRVGAAQDLAELDIELAANTQAGGWKSTRMPLQMQQRPMRRDLDGKCGRQVRAGANVNSVELSKDTKRKTPKKTGVIQRFFRYCGPKRTRVRRVGARENF